jgi:hypothetical protein
MQASSSEQQAGHDSRSARRRLIRGTFAAPVALTLVSGSAAAASNCVDRQVKNAAYLPADTGERVAWVRVPVWVLTVNGNNKDSLWIKGEEIAALAKNPATSFVSSDKWFCLSAGGQAKINAGSNVDFVSVSPNNGYTVSPSPPQSGQPNSLKIAQSSTRMVAIRVNAVGDIIGVVGDGGTTGSGISASCWSSFRR